MPRLILVPKERHWFALEQADKKEIRRAGSREHHDEVDDPPMHIFDRDSEKKHSNGELDYSSRGRVGHFTEPPELLTMSV